MPRLCKIEGLGGLLVLACLLQACLADIYLHNPRGSNNRLRENNANRANNNRLFDSQNNNEGGYNIGDKLNTAPGVTAEATIGRLRYFVGSKLRVEWTNQHGCNNPKMHCNMVLQYMCDRNSNKFQTVAIDDGTDGTGTHESADYHNACNTRSRNKGLFLAGQNLNNNNGARRTRQNPNGNRSGNECPEERDYYPYWHPTPWKDIAVMVDSDDICDDYKTLTSENTTPRHHCLDGNGDATAQNNQADCTANGNTWSEGESWGLSHPACVTSQTTRVNHLGNAEGTIETPYYDWTIPSTQDACGASTCPKCVMRLRYNMTVGDYDPRPISEVNSEYSTAQVSASGKTSFVLNNNQAEGNRVLQNIMGNGLQLAFNTQQTGRTFQDRTHSFSIEPVPNGIDTSKTIYNINVRGRRGNIVQVYPAVEYDFVPSSLTMNAGDYVHFAWTGSNTSPNGIDRSNVLQMGRADLNYPTHMNYITMFTADNSKQYSGKTATVDGFALGEHACDTSTTAGLAELAVLSCQYATQDHGLLQMSTKGTFHYMSTVNNDFTNRGHKGKITVQ